MKSKTVSFRIDSDEWEKLTETAKSAGFNKLTQFARHQLSQLQLTDRQLRERGRQLELTELARLRKLIRDCFSVLAALNRIQSDSATAELHQKAMNIITEVDQWLQKFTKQ